MQGGGYYSPDPQPNFELLKVGRGTPGGELLRRYWQPIGLVSDLGERPVRVRALGEDLVMFKDTSGQIGLLAEHCCHRGASLYYGKIEEDGLRCCYHSWKFGPTGKCLSMPCEPAEERFKQRIRQPWYPVREYHGMIFAYMGPLDKIPAFPKWDVLEELAEDYVVYADGQSNGMGGPVIGKGNWLQYFDNMMDPFHVYCLHMGISAKQFQEEMGLLPKVSWHKPDDESMYTYQDRALPNNKIFRRITQVFFPNVRVVAPINPDQTGYGKGGFIGFYLPVDDTHTRLFGLWPVKPDNDGEIRIGLADYDGKLWSELTEEEHQKMPGDYEAISGIGEFACHNLEHLGFTDQGITKLRAGIKKQIKCVQEGKDPARSYYDKEEILISTETGNFILDADNS